MNLLNLVPLVTKPQVAQLQLQNQQLQVSLLRARRVRNSQESRRITGIINGNQAIINSFNLMNPIFVPANNNAAVNGN